MTLVEKFHDAGFTTATIVAETRGHRVIRVRTSNGWVYEKIKADDADFDVAAWAERRQLPE